MKNNISSLDVTIKQYNVCFIALIAYCTFNVILYCIFVSYFGANNVFDLYGFLYWCVDYSNGFATRGLAGQILLNPILSLPFDPIVDFFVFKAGYMIALYVLFLIAVRICTKNKPFLIIPIALMFIRMGYFIMVRYLFNVDMFWYACFAVIVFLLWKDTRISLKMPFVMCFTLIAMLFHQAFIFIFAPIVCLILIDKKQKVWFFIYSIFTCLVFLIVDVVGCNNYDLIYNRALSVMCELGLYDIYGEYIVSSNHMGAFTLEYATSRFDHMSRSDLILSYKNCHFPKLIITVFSSFFSLITSVSTIKEYIMTKIDNKFVKILIPAVVIIPFAALLAFIIDCERWFIQTLLGLNVFTVYIMDKYDIKFVIKKSIYAGSLIFNFVAMPLLQFAMV